MSPKVKPQKLQTGSFSNSDASGLGASIMVPIPHSGQFNQIITELRKLIHGSGLNGSESIQLLRELSEIPLLSIVESVSRGLNLLGSRCRQGDGARACRRGLPSLSEGSSGEFYRCRLTGSEVEVVGQEEGYHARGNGREKCLFHARCKSFQGLEHWNTWLEISLQTSA